MSTTSVVARDVAAIRMKKNTEDIVGAGERIAGNITTRNSPEIAKMRAAIGDANVGVSERNVANTTARNTPENARTRAIEDADVGAREGNVANTARDAKTKSAKERNVTDAAAGKRKTLRGTNADALAKVILFYKISSSQYLPFLIQFL